MEGEIESGWGGLVMSIPTSRDASRNNNNNNNNITICQQPVPSTQKEQEMAPLVSSAGVPFRRPLVPLVSSTTAKRTQSAVFISSISVTSSTLGDHIGVEHDSAAWSLAKFDPHSTAFGQHIPSNSTQALSQCTDINGRKTITTQNTCRLPDFNELPCSPHVTKVEANDPQDTCKYVNIEHSTVNPYHNEFGAKTQISCRKEAASDVHCSSKAGRNYTGCRDPLRRGPAPKGNLSSWVRVVKPEMNCSTSLGTEESWPSLLACRMKGETSKQNIACNNSHVMLLSTRDVAKPLVNASAEHESAAYFGHHANIENRSKPYTTPAHNSSQEALLDDLCWPSLEKPCSRRSVVQYNYCSGKERTLQPLGSSNFHCHSVVSSTMQNQKRKGQHGTAHGGLLKTENMHMPPIFLMLNRDFIVTSPLKENLLLTLALMEKRPAPEAPKDLQSQMPAGETKRQILVGQFKALSSFLHFVLGRDATRVRTESNAGGTSTISESLSVEYFVRRFQARDIVTEMEVEYCSFNWKKVDYICTLYGQRVGVSVTRAMSFPDPKDFSAQMAYTLLYKKLFGLVVARHGVSKQHSFSQCILHVWCETQQTAKIMQREYDGVSQELDIADDVVMVLTVADGCHTRPIFYESILRNASQ